jgi:intracellular septation protein A
MALFLGADWVSVVCMYVFIACFFLSPGFVDIANATTTTTTTTTATTTTQYILQESVMFVRWVPNPNAVVFANKCMFVDEERQHWIAAM